METLDTMPPADMIMLMSLQHHPTKKDLAFATLNIGKWIVRVPYEAQSRTYESKDKQWAFAVQRQEFEDVPSDVKFRIEGILFYAYCMTFCG